MALERRSGGEVGMRRLVSPIYAQLGPAPAHALLLRRVMSGGRGG
jgi:hypothetical protein